MNKLDGLVLIVPALNEASSIREVLHACIKLADVIVIDDGSIDNTSDIAREEGAIVIRHVVNLGYDASIRSGLYAGSNLGYSYAITLDADGQHDANEIVNFYHTLLGGADLVVGIRAKKPRLGELIFSIVSRILWGIRDPLCGLKAYRLSYMKRNIHIGRHDSIGTEIAIKMKMHGCKFAQLNVSVRDRFGNSRFGSGVIANYKILKALSYAIKSHYLS